VYSFHLPIVGNLLGLVPIPDFYEGIVQLFIADFAFPQLRR
jgi:hypothetical protein